VERGREGKRGENRTLPYCIKRKGGQVDRHLYLDARAKRPKHRKKRRVEVGDLCPSTLPKNTTVGIVKKKKRKHMIVEDNKAEGIRPTPLLKKVMGQIQEKKERKEPVILLAAQKREGCR